MAGTSRRPHVVTSQRRDVGSTNIKVNKRQRRDISTSFASQSLKEKVGPEFKGDRRSRKYELGHGNHHSSRTLTLEKGHHFVSSYFRTKRLMFYRLTICVFSFSMF